MILQQLLDEVLDENVPVSRLLRKAKILSIRMNQDDILEWIEDELSGYERNAKVPDYRVISGQVKAWNPYHGWVPLISKNADVEQAISKRGSPQSVSEIEELLKNSDNSTYEMHFPDSIAADYQGRL